MKNKITNILVIVLLLGTTLMPLFQAGAFILAPGTPVVVTADVPRTISETIQNALGTAFATFAAAFTGDMLKKVEKNYKIANFLYYTDALVQGKYLQNYFDKYVPATIDQRMILNFIPQFSCNKNQGAVQNQLLSAAKKNLGFDPSDPTQFNPSSPDFLDKLAKLGEFTNSPNGLAVTYQGIAQQAENSALAAAQNEISSPGIKASQGTSGNDILKSANSTIQNEASNFASSLALGTNKPDSIVGKIAGQISYQFISSFAFQGATFKEQATCLPSTTLDPIVSNNTPTYTPVTPPNTAPNVYQTGTQFQSLQHGQPVTTVYAGDTITLKWDFTNIDIPADSIKQVVLSPLGQEVPLSGNIDVVVDQDSVSAVGLIDANGNLLRQYSIIITAVPPPPCYITNSATGTSGAQFDQACLDKLNNGSGGSGGSGGTVQ